MRTITILFIGFLLTYSGLSQAKTADAFFKRFQIVRSSEGKLIGIRDKTLPVNFSVDPYVKLIKKQLLNEQHLLSLHLASGDYETDVRDIIGEDQNFYGDKAQFNANVQTTIDSLKKLAVLNVDFVFSHQLFKDVVEKYQGKMTDAIMLLDPTMVANVNDPTYFYKKNVTYKAVTWGLDLAHKVMSNVPMLNTVSYVIVQVEKLITERRQFHQNMLLHYLENFKEEELGLTHEEVNIVWSSIYESRIQWYAFWESSSAKANWAKYGVNNFYMQFRNGTTNLKNAQVLYSSIDERVNFAFQKVTLDNNKVIINLFEKEGMFQNRPAVAFNYDQPTVVVRKRILLNLAQLGLSFVPLSSMIKDNVSLFLKSFYEKQKITEGALYGYFESNGDVKGLNQVNAQYLNPFDNLSI